MVCTTESGIKPITDYIDIDWFPNLILDWVDCWDEPGQMTCIDNCDRYCFPKFDPGYRTPIPEFNIQETFQDVTGVEIPTNCPWYQPELADLQDSQISVYVPARLRATARTVGHIFQ